ncbi:MAG: hypothetical protein ACYCZJ_13355 [Sulfuriferula sp.]
MPNQIPLQMPVRPDEISRKQTLGAAMEMCAELGGDALDKTLQQELEVDKAQFSRWQSGTEGILWPKLKKMMDTCGNDAPLLWMLHQRGYDLYSPRKRETETEQKLRETQELLEKERVERAAIEAALRRMLVGVTS